MGLSAVGGVGPPEGALGLLLNSLLFAFLISVHQWGEVARARHKGTQGQGTRNMMLPIVAQYGHQHLGLDYVGIYSLQLPTYDIVGRIRTHGN